jgi:hypothetical protein
MKRKDIKVIPCQKWKMCWWRSKKNLAAGTIDTLKTAGGTKIDVSFVTGELGTIGFWKTGFLTGLFFDESLAIY